MYFGSNNKPEHFVLNHLHSVFCQIMTFRNQIVPMKELASFMCQIVFIIPMFVYFLFTVPVSA
jgi:Zn-dependent membrane protease YugP